MSFPRAAVPGTVLALALAVGACSSEAPTPIAAGDPNIVDVAVASGDFSTLVSALQAAGLVSTLQGDGPFTVFAPSDDAFASLPDGALDALLADPELLTRVLLYHVVPGRVLASEVVGLSSATTVNGADVTITAGGGTVMIDDATVIATDIEATNGVIHVIDDVLFPEVVFDVIQTAQDAGGFGTLLAALGAAGLTDFLGGDGPFTVFAPTDDAFAALPAHTIEALLADTDRLTDILTYHVVAGAVTSDVVVTLPSAETLNGASVEITVEGGSVMVDGASVTVVDIEATNGIIHVIDAVLLPEPLPTVVDIATGSDDFTTLVAALSAADLVGTLQGDGPFTVFAPTNAAFEALPSGVVDDLLADVDLLTRVLTYHVTPDLVTSTEVVGLSTAPTLNGKDIAVSVDGGSVMLDDATVIATDIAAVNGIVHVIDEVLLPEIVFDIVQTAEDAGSFQTLLAALEVADLTGVLEGDGPFTVFAPTDDAFAALPEADLAALLADPASLADVLLYHVIADEVTSAEVVGLTSATMANGDDVAISVAGSTVVVNDASVVAVDIAARNGVIHVLDKVILPPPAGQ